MVYFENGLILGQLEGHYGMYEIYTHLYASFFLFFASIFSVAVIFYTLKRSVFSLPALTGGVIYIGLIGLGEGFEHLPFIDPFVQSMAHYLHLFSAPVAVFTLYMGMIDTVSIIKDGPQKAKLHSTELGMGIFAAISLGVVIMAFVSHTPYNERIEGPFLLAILLPTLFFVWLVLKESRHFAESTEMLYLPILSIAVSLLTLDIWIGRFADVSGLAGLYVLTHAFQDTLLAVTGGIILIFSMHIWYSHRIGRLFVLGKSSREEAKEKNPRPPEKRKFKLDEQ